MLPARGARVRVGIHRRGDTSKGTKALVPSLLDEAQTLGGGQPPARARVRAGGFFLPCTAIRNGGEVHSVLGMALSTAFPPLMTTLNSTLEAPVLAMSFGTCLRRVEAMSSNLRSADSPQRRRAPR